MHISSLCCDECTELYDGRPVVNSAAVWFLPVLNNIDGGERNSSRRLTGNISLLPSVFLSLSVSVSYLLDADKVRLGLGLRD